MLNEKMLLKEVHDNLICNSAALRKVFQFEGGELVQNGEKIDYVVAGKHMFITYIPYDFEGKDIDLRIRKRLAEEFLELHTLESLKAEYIVELDKQEEEEKKKLEVFEQTKKLAIQLKDVLSRFKRVEARQWTTGSQVIAEWSCKDYTYRYINVSHKIEVRIAGEGYSINHEYAKDGYTKNDLYKFDSLQELEAFISNTLYPLFDKVQEEAQTRLQEQQRREEKDNEIERLLLDISSGKSWYILRSKRTYTAISGRKKYSMKGEGKFQKANYTKVRDDIKNGKIEAYAVVPNNEWADRKTYLDLEYITF